MLDCRRRVFTGGCAMIPSTEPGGRPGVDQSGAGHGTGAAARPGHGRHMRLPSALTAVCLDTELGYTPAQPLPALNINTPD